MNEEWVATQKDFIRGREAKTLVIDCEISPARAWFYPPTHEAKIVHIDLPQKIISMAWQWTHETKIHALSIFDFQKKTGIENIDDKPLAEMSAKLMEEADMVVGHNARDFDMKIMRTRIASNNFQPPDEGKIEDTLKILRKYFKLERNTLEYACNYFGIEGKTQRTHSEILHGFLEGNPKDIRDMIAYNKQDVKINRLLYDKISPWHKTHYNLNLITRGHQLCKVCLANGRPGNKFKKKGISWESTFGRQKYQCLVDGHYWRGEKVARSARPDAPEKEIERVEQFSI